MKPSLASKNKCTGCMACADACNNNAINPYIDKNGYWMVNINKDKCIGCKLCEKKCPIVSHFSYSNTQKLSKPYAAWNTNLDQRKKSASGGVFAAIATAILNKKGVVYGAAISDFDVIHKRIDKIEDLHLLQGSKYQQGNLFGIYKQIRNDLKYNIPVLFSGTGCQVAALLSFLGDSKHDNLFTIDIICGGFPSILPMRVLQQYNKKITKVISYRDKEKGWKSTGYKYELKMGNINGKIVNYENNNIVTRSFTSALIQRNSCLDCQFAHPYRKSDITIGDFWGDTKFVNEHFSGLSIMIMHNDRLNQFISNNLKSEPILWQDFIPYNYRYIWGNKKIINYLFDRYILLLSLRHHWIFITNGILSNKSLFSYGRRLFLHYNAVKQRKYINHYLSLNNENRLTNNI